MSGFLLPLVVGILECRSAKFHMPELPEVETVVRGLRQSVLGQVVKSVEIRAAHLAEDNPKGVFDNLASRKISEIRRRGKNILIDLDGKWTLWVHLKMTGHLYYLPSCTPPDKHDHLIIDFKDNSRHLRFNDYRKFGRVRLFKSDEIMVQEGLIELGPEPLELSRDDFVTLLQASHRMIKPALLDQTFIAGLGNIYSDEALFEAGIHPRRLTDTLSRVKLEKLHGAIWRLLKKAIRLMGTSVDSFAGVNGRPGGFQKYLKVYGRENTPCTVCGSKIRHEKIGSRTAHYCPRCQRG